ncbi:MAG TPA: hypothetical protein VGY58_02515 [Gemmataceae bacterium]|jgi:hypothetical protein|nr:hypothetical protein [Gemmataceae bacterium]
MILEHIFSLWGMIIVAIVCSMLGGAIAVVAKQWRKAREAEIEASLKAELIKQGRSAEEIDKILRSTGRSSATE